MSEKIPLLPMSRERAPEIYPEEGWWTVLEGRFLIYRTSPKALLMIEGQSTFGWQERGRCWAVEAQSHTAQTWLIQQGLRGLYFPTRRAALQRLQDALRLDESGPPPARL